MDKVYIIFENHFQTNSRTVYAVYGPKAKKRAKKDVDALNKSVAEDENTEYSLQAYDVINSNKEEM